MGQEPRQTTSNTGHLHKPAIQALIHGLNRHYYSIAINFRKTELEQTMLLNLHKQNWTEGLLLKDFEEHSKQNEESVKVGLYVRETCLMLTFVTENAVVGFSVQQVCTGGVDAYGRRAQNTACGQAGSKAPSRRRGRECHG